MTKTDEMIVITRQDLIEVSATVCAEDPMIKEMIKSNPALLLAFGIFSAKVATRLFVKEEDHE